MPDPGSQVAESERGAQIALVYEEALRAIEQQQSIVVGLHSRASTLLSAASISTAVFGGLALQGRPASTWVWVAIALFVLTFVSAIVLLWPYSWVFRRSAKAILRDYVEGENPTDFIEMQRQLACYLEDNYEDNERRLKALFFVFQSACIVLSLEIVAWLIELT